MTTDFVDLNAQIDPQAIGDGAVDQLRATFAANGYPDWTANDAALEIILIYVLALWAADTAQLSAQARLAIFRAFGTKLMNLPYLGGASATAQSTWQLVDTLGHTIPGGTYLTVADHGFYVLVDVAVPAGSGAATGVSIVAVENGTDYNGLTGPVQLVEQIDWVAPNGITLAAATSGGADAETDDAYTTRLGGQLALQAPRPITASDYATMALSVPSTLVSAGVVVGRATALDGYDPTAHTFTGTIATGSPNVTGMSSTVGVTAGSQLSGTGIPAGVTFVSVNAAAASGVMSANATTTATETITATGSYSNTRTVTTFVTDPLGNALPSDAMTAIQNWLATFREINFVPYVKAPSYNTIYVTAQIHALPGYDPTALVASVQQALLNYLSPAQWGNPLYATSPSGSASQWLNSGQGFATIRYNKILNVIESVLGVDYVPGGSAGLAIGFAPSPSGTSDLTMSGPAPLPKADVTTPTVVVTAV